ncbi:NACHT domain-containing protein [Pseudovibrio exalbescens]|uniref:NACHT domain-containing protein n=1 Tax=Pseudovibrio exalbescens TaxID=197461 RepID=A0A1U7JDZ6_9HYPH|nr:NACHT domain-containing protein [Pseudovibrio exalbescens]OKL42902.1 hypothetical protein A3843_16215 [Pseudovibrio exalbescens]
MCALETAAAIGTIASFSLNFYDRFSQRFVLPMRMKRALGNRDDAPKATYIEDSLERALGSAGLLTNAASLVLGDLSNSGLLDLLIPLFGSDLDKGPSVTLIEYMYISRGGCVTDSHEFAEKLVACLSEAFKYEVEKSYSDLPVPMRKDLRRNFIDASRKAETTILSVTQNLKDSDGEWLPGANVNPVKIASLIEKYTSPLKLYVASAVEALNSSDIHGASGDVVQVELDSIYVDVPVNEIFRKGNFVKYRDLRKYLPRNEIASSWSETYARIENTVLLGDPGGGKSTLSKKMCLECGRKFLSGDTSLPLFIQLRTYIARAVDDENLSLTDFILDHIRAAIVDPDEDYPIDSLIIYHLRIGAAFVVFDGLDEVLTSSNRARVVGEIRKFVREFRFVKVLVTSRYVGYESNPLSGFTHLGIEDLNSNAISQIYRNVSSSVLSKSEKEIEEKHDDFIRDAKRKAAELIRSPLLLTLIVIVYNKKVEIPDNRASLYSFCAELLFDRWDGYRAITPDLPERYRLFDLFKHLSAILYEREEYGGRISKQDLIEESRDFFRKDYIDNREGKSAQASKLMVGHLTGRAWILHEVGEDIFEFTHRTFLEFFYAKYLESKFEGTNDLACECLKHVTHGARAVPSHLALQLRSKDKRDAASRIVDELARKLEAEQRNYELVGFCADSIEYLLPHAENMSNFVGVLAPQIFYFCHPNQIEKVLCTETPLRTTVIKSAFDSIKSISTVDEMRSCRRALHVLSSKRIEKVDLGSDGCVDLIKTLFEQTYSKQASSPYLCKMAFDFDARVNWKAMKRFGQRVWFSKSDVDLMLGAQVDTCHMVSEASNFLRSADYKGGKYLTFAMSIQQTFDMRKVTKNYFSPPMYKNVADVDICYDPDSWREDRSALEVFAFCLWAYVVINGRLLNKNSQLHRLRVVFENLIVALENVGSDKAPEYREWIDGSGKYADCDIFLRKELSGFWQLAE